MAQPTIQTSIEIALVDGSGAMFVDGNNLAIVYVITPQPVNLGPLPCIVNGTVFPTNPDEPAYLNYYGMKALGDPPNTRYNVTINYPPPVVLTQPQFVNLFLGVNLL
jgi:hypothetical protein